MVPKLKESLNSVMTISAKVLEFNSRVDYTGADQSRPPSVDQNIQTRRDLENSFEDFYHTADMLEAQIKLAQQQCMNTLQAVSTVGPQYVHLLPRGKFRFYYVILHHNRQNPYLSACSQILFICFSNI